MFIIQASDSELTLAGSDVTSTVLSRPYVNAATDGQEAVVVAFPVNRTGSVSIGADSQVYGGEFNFVAKFIRGVETDWDLIAGLRCMVLEEGINVQQSTTAGTGNNMRFNGAAVAAGSVVSAFDSFETQNRFAGAQIGVRQECRLAHLLLGWQFKVAAGVNRQTIDINGASTRTTGGVTTTLPGGVLALPTNIGRVVLNDFTVVPQLQFTVGYQCAENLRFWAAYECLIWSNAVRPGAQIDPQLDVTQLPTSASFNAAAAATRPIATLDQNSVLIQGISIGMEMKY
ncbi:MAG: BBP7 family outer membrane beta-barrel protein [Planctomycetia bacterium]|nr:BBP7 family outer membrane beta-barrel protein [Planctomycetia bacterium]